MSIPHCSKALASSVFFSCLESSSIEFSTRVSHRLKGLSLQEKSGSWSAWRRGSTFSVAQLHRSEINDFHIRFTRNNHKKLQSILPSQLRPRISDRLGRDAQQYVHAVAGREEAPTSHSADPQTTSSESSDKFAVWANGGGAVHVRAHVDASTVVEIGAVVHGGAEIRADSHIGAGSVVGPNVNIGQKTKLMYNVSLQNCSLGDNCLIHNGVCIGQDGFGFTVNEQGQVVKKPQELRVVVGSSVEIGANTCIDRGSWRDTSIGDHTKIDNLVQIGHNVVIGRCCIICGQVGLGGSSTVGDYVVLGGKAGVQDHASIVSKVRIAAKSGVVGHITEPGDYAGFPAVPAAEWRRAAVMIRRLGRPQAAAASKQRDGKVKGEEEKYA